MKHTRNGNHDKSDGNGRRGPKAAAAPALESAGPALITGGAGFIGTNVAVRLLRSGRDVVLLDNLSRSGVERNLAWLQERYGRRVRFLPGDVRDRRAVRQAVQGVSQVFHFAAQVAVTTSLQEPQHDFEVNVGGTLNLLEELRALPTPPPLVYTSTNKVYGALEHLPLRRDGGRYEPEDAAVRASGVGEDCPRDFHSPYGCSKGAADQYVLDYARSFGMRTVVFRMSCIYGPHQFGTEDQGWVAHFLICALDGRPLTIYGDGMQVRDILFVEDLAEAFVLAQANIDRLSGRAFNIGGGVDNTVSLVELLGLIREIHGEAPPTERAGWRTGDQRYYVSDISRFRDATGWAPRVGVREGVERLYEWLLESRGLARGNGLLAGKGAS